MDSNTFIMNAQSLSRGPGYRNGDASRLAKAVCKVRKKNNPSDQEGKPKTTMSKEYQQNKKSKNKNFSSQSTLDSFFSSNVEDPDDPSPLISDPKDVIHTFDDIRYLDEDEEFAPNFVKTLLEIPHVKNVFQVLHFCALPILVTEKINGKELIKTEIKLCKIMNIFNDMANLIFLTPTKVKNTLYHKPTTNGCYAHLERLVHIADGELSDITEGNSSKPTLMIRFNKHIKEALFHWIPLSKYKKEEIIENMFTQI